MDCHDVVPIDTHMWQIYQAKYQKKSQKDKTMKYDKVKNDFRQIFGEYAGIIHSFLFTSQLKDFSKKSVAVKAQPENSEKMRNEPDTGLEQNSEQIANN